MSLHICDDRVLFSNIVANWLLTVGCHCVVNSNIGFS